MATAALFSGFSDFASSGTTALAPSAVGDAASGGCSAPIGVYLVDDQAMIRAAFRSWIEQAGGMSVVGDCGTAVDAIREIGRLHPDVALLDITMPGLSGIDALSSIRGASPSTRVIIVSDHEGESFVHAALANGANGYLAKSAEPDELATAIAAVMRGETFISPGLVKDGVDAARNGDSRGTCGLDGLTPRELEVFLLLAKGWSNKQIARELGVSLGTAKKHRENLQRKLDCHSSAELARLAIREGLLAE